ncbi:MAG: pilus assembly protein [bacterium]
MEQTGHISKKAVERVLVSIGIGAFLWLSLPLPAYAAGGALQPQILVIFDTSQGMAGDLQGAIMSGSGTVAANASSSSPVCYIESGYSPRASSALASNGTSCATGYAPYTVSVGGILTDNSESMINVAEQGLIAAFLNPQYSSLFQMGLMDYATAGAPSAYRTWVYYMSNNNSISSTGAVVGGAFAFGTSATSTSTLDPLSVANPCYNITTAACTNVESVLGSGIGSDSYLYINATSDDPQINDVLYASSSLKANFISYNKPVSAGPTPSVPYNTYTLQGYEDQILNSSPLWEKYNKWSGGGGAWATSPTDAGYTAYSGQVWYAQRGYAYDGGPVVSGNQGNMVVNVASLGTSLAALQAALAPEQFPLSGQSAGGEIVAGSEYAPMAGALNNALTYFTAGLSSSSPAPTPTCDPKFVILITDGQPTMGVGGHVYPPLGSAAATGYGEVLSPGSANNDNAVTESVTAVKALYNNTGAGGSIQTFVLGVGPGINCPQGTTSGCSPEAAEGYTVLQDLATAGHTNTVYNAQSASQFQAAFQSILSAIEAEVYTSNGSSAPNTQAGSYQFELQSTPAYGTGNLLAYTILANGSVSSTPTWDANVNMTTANRGADLYTNAASTSSTTPGALTLIANMPTVDPAAFGNLSGTGLTASDIANYTIDPSYNGGAYLGGRTSGWYVGLTESQSPVVLTPPGDANLLGDPSYVAYAQAQLARPALVLFPSDDGFLYAIGAGTTTATGSTTGGGALAWGWMPLPLVQGLQNYTTFWQGANMAGGMRAVDAEDATGTWYTYLVGTAEQGDIEYALQLSNSTLGTLNAETWEQDYSNVIAPNTTVPVIYRPSASLGTAYDVEVLNAAGGSTSSSLVITEVGTGTSFTLTTPFFANSQAYIDPAGNIYIGDNAGNVWEGSLIGSSGGLATSISWIPLNNSTANPGYANFGTVATTSGGAGAINDVTGVNYNGEEYLVLQSSDRLTVIADGSVGWQPLWTSYVSGGATFSGGQYVSSTSVVSLPTGSTVTDPATLVGGSITLPVSVAPASSLTCSLATAYSYDYSLTNGTFPLNVILSATGGSQVGPATLGYGNAYGSTLSIMGGQVRIVGGAETLGSSVQSGGGPPVGGLTVQFGGGPPVGGPAAWREVP